MAPISGSADAAPGVTVNDSARPAAAAANPVNGHLVNCDSFQRVVTNLALARRGGRPVVSAGGTIGSGRASLPRGTARGLPGAAVTAGSTGATRPASPTGPTSSTRGGGRVAVGAGPTDAPGTAVTAGATGTAIADQHRAGTPCTAVAAGITGPAGTAGAAGAAAVAGAASAAIAAVAERA